MAEVRLQKLLSERGVASRRKAEELIEQGRVKVNGRVAKLGDKADDRRDVILVAGKRLGRAEAPVYILLHKPRGYITTMSDEKGRKCVEELVRDVGVRVYPIGRLDKDSEGMLLLTNDGDFANAIMHPASHVPKRYRVTLRAAISDEQILKFEEGIPLDRPGGADRRQQGAGAFRGGNRTVRGAQPADSPDVRGHGAAGRAASPGIHRRGEAGDAAGGQVALSGA